MRTCPDCARADDHLRDSSHRIRDLQSLGMVEARYDAVAEFYIEGFDSIDDPASRALLDLLGPVAGLQVLDVACGHGRITRELARRGASVVGVDVSGALITRARETEQDEQLGIRYLHEDVTMPGSLGGFDGGFDVAACNFGLSDIDDLDAAITAIGDALGPRGCFAFSIVHPCFAGGQEDRPLVSVRQLLRRGTLDGPRRPFRSTPAPGASHRTLFRPTSIRCAATVCGWTSSPSRSRSQTESGPQNADCQPVFLVARCIKLPSA